VPNYKDGVGNYKGGQGGAKKVKQTSDITVTSSTTLVNTDLLYAMSVGKSYNIIGILAITSPAAADYKITFVKDGTLAYSTAEWGHGGANMRIPEIAIGSTSTLGTNAAIQIFAVFTSVIQVTTAGTLTMQFSQQTSNGGDTILHTGSYIIVHEI